MSIRLIALDLDGTTINNDRVISRRNRETLELAAEKGVKIVIATGRPFCALPSDVFEMKGVRYVLTSNGAAITDLEKNEIIYSNCLAPETVEKAVELLRGRHYVIEGFVRGNAYIEKAYYEHVKNTGKSFRDVSYILNTRKPVEDIYGFILNHRTQVENINVNFEDIGEKPAMREELLKLPDATITSSFRHNLEIGGATTSKAEALRRMRDIFGIKKEEMMAVGDSPNDMAMLMDAGLAVAVANAEDEVKAVAGYIAPSNHDDGVADAVERFVL